MNSYYGSVNGPACHYARLARYNNCSLAEVAATPQTSGFSGLVKDKDYNQGANDYKFDKNVPVPTLPQFTRPPTRPPGAQTPGAPPAPPAQPPTPPAAPPAAPPAQPPTAPVTEGFTEPDYTPTYKVPNYPPINTDALTHGVAYNCGGYFNILDAYGQNGGASGSGGCVTNFVNN